MEERYTIPAREARAEIVVVNSRFVATAAPALTVEAARAFIARIRAEFGDATHNVPAYLVGYGASVIAHCSDDGEPAGTAGRPALTILRGSGLGDVAVVVTRYFGGTKLGTGGLVRAYSAAVRAVLEVLPRAVKAPTHTVLMALPYRYLEPVRHLVDLHGGHILGEEFAADVTVTARFDAARLPHFQDDLQQLSSGGIEAVVIESNPAAILPLPPGAWRCSTDGG
ncbi:MAG: YigZ family protein [Anaerolineae bacterium]|nr:YigZ family protein [Anaerolineae bacterium]